MSEKPDLTPILDELRAGDKFLLTTHLNPDGDALGSLLGMHETLSALGKDSVMFMAADQFPLPDDLDWMPLGDIVSEVPGDLGERIVVFLDCGNIDRMPVEELKTGGKRILDIDHHHDNTRFGDVNLVIADASSTAEIVFHLAEALGVQITSEIAEPLYVGLLTDTGRFMYENTSAEAHRVASRMLDAGVDVPKVYRELFEGLPIPRLLLLGRALANLERYDDVSLTLTHLTRADFDATQTGEGDSEGVVDYFRAVENTAVGALVRARLTEGDENSSKVSLRATDERVDVSKIAREFGGGGHRQAAGFFTDLSLEDLVAQLREQIGAQL
ncbi:MAG: bifunctional oligoribonuclease and phosphatase NrnA [Thermoleophilaceae bacterium]|jgi:phosphoesterase RecJ-like protein|nr:bifunctional oligoribonuclease and phosphatase NrnA [Thermoleophilaceae bacterium]